MPDTAPIDGVAEAVTHRWRAAIVGGRLGPDGKPIALRAYRLGCAMDPECGRLIVTMIEDVPGIGITFEADDFDHAFSRALVIGQDMAEAAGHLDDGVVISLGECDSLAELGIE